MKLTRLFALLALFTAAFSWGTAQTTVTTEHSVAAPVTTVETRTYVTPDGKSVTERVTTNVQTEREAVAKSTAPKTYTAAVVVSNRAGKEYDNKILVLQDLISARITDLGFSLLSREIVVDNLRKFDANTASADRPSNSLDAQLTEQSSALRLAQNMGADYIVQASITSYAATKRQVKAYGLDYTNHEYSLRVTYAILDASGGGSLTSDIAKPTRTEQVSANETNMVEGVFDDLLDEATKQITDSLRTRIAAGRITAPKLAAKLVTITIKPEAADLFIPDVRINAENVVTVGESKFKVTPLSATVEVDGVAVGTAPGQITLRRGFSKLRISREGFDTWERTISAVDGQVLTVAMKMSDDGYARFRDATAFINDLKNGAKLTDAHVKEIEGKAKMLENSFFKVDTKENFRFILPDRYKEAP
jgi:PEGA domain